MPSLIWSPRAVEDVQRLYRFLLSKNPDAAGRAVKAIREGVKVLTLQAKIGRPVENMPDEYREWLISFGHSGYVARYRIQADESIMILAVRHQKELGP